MDSQYSGYYSNLLRNDSPETFDQVDETNHPTLSEKVSEVGTTSRKAQRTKNFTRQEDILLVSAWLNTSKDAITGNDQQHGSFWKRIYDYFTTHEGTQYGRTQTSLMNRWSDINAKCAKFVGYVNQIDGRNPSGDNVEGRVTIKLLNYA